MYKFEYLNNLDANYIEDLFERYQNDPNSIDESWQYFFDGMELGGDDPSATPIVKEEKGATVVELRNGKLNLSDEAKVAELINAYRSMGRLLANTDPLSDAQKSHPLLELENFGLSSKDLEQKFTAGRLVGMGEAKLKDILQFLKDTYCSSIGVEYTHIQDPVAREWLQNRMESSRNRENLDPETKKEILRHLTKSEAFERFIHTRYVAQKRFSIEGAESLIPGLHRMISVLADLGANNVVMGMAHRGRLNVLTNIYGKAHTQIFTEFEQNYQTDTAMGEGDVKYHMGYSADIKTANGHDVHLSLAHNPSHLEFVDPVVEGVARAKQRDLGDVNRTQVIPILIHGDAAFAGQGVVYETLGLSQLKGYTTGGTLHIVIDNQIGFTTNPQDSRSTPYATDLAKMLDTPIFHVNGDDPEAVYYVAKLCSEYRQKFKKDVFIDLICYRKYGHNEGDEPSFTQPVLYKKIKSHTSPREIYSKKLISEGTINEEDSKAMSAEENQTLQDAQTKTRSENPKPVISAYQNNKWKKLRPATDADVFKPVDTKVDGKKLLELAEKLNTIPPQLNQHPKLARFLDLRLKAWQSGEGIDWGNGETLAYASLLVENHTIRLSGQDAERGTFSHRHSVINDYENGNKFTPLNHLEPDQSEFIVYNSSLSEAGVLGFEYGWSLADPDALIIWEAQFGDFANGAQVIIDQFISSSESKWRRASGIVLFLPHGYEGMGPEHSSARFERFLQLCGKNNMAVCNFTTPAQLFHALRRQVKREFRKPLVVMTPKSLLRHPKAVSSIEDFSEKVFQEVLDDPVLQSEEKKEVKRIALCTGKVYYDLAAEQEESQIKDVAIIRLEQLYQWPGDLLAKVLEQYPKAEEVVWVQEEPRNMGAWTYIFNNWNGGYCEPYRDCLSESLKKAEIQYIGRDIGAAPAVGSSKIHQIEQKAIVQKAMHRE